MSPLFWAHRARPKTFPRIRFFAVPEGGTPGAELIQSCSDELGGKE